MIVSNISPTSIAHNTEETERHVHSPEVWFGKSADQSGNNWAADTLTPFQAIGGSGDYGGDADDEALVLGSDDTPTDAAFFEFDMRRIMVDGASEDSAYKLRVCWGTGTIGEAISAGQCSEFMLKDDNVGNVEADFPIELQMPQLDSGTKVWIQCKNATDNATVDFFVGIHEYFEES